MKYLNLGCGSRFHKDWINIDFVSLSSDVIEYDLTKGIPLDENSVDVVYHSHVLEHFSKIEGINFINECNRVLKPKGIIRIVVPDLEQLALEYIKALNKVSEDNNSMNEANYNWSVIELLDQLVREKSGGEMLEFWKQNDLINESKITQRVGDEFLRIRKYLIQNKSEINTEINFTKRKRIRTRIKDYLYKKLRVNQIDLEIGNFRNGGEIHKWMYDRHSLRKLLINNGYENISFHNGISSNIPEWNRYNFLDIENNKIRKPDSLIIEAFKQG
jgi:predicted SAM-dependent methyltransferase